MACGGSWSGMWEELGWHVGGARVACGRSWCGMWEELGWHVGGADIIWMSVCVMGGASVECLDKVRDLAYCKYLIFSY